MIAAILAVLASTANAGVPPGQESLCGLEEVRRPELRICPPGVTYDEDGEKVDGSGQDRAGLGNAQSAADLDSD